MLVEQLFGQLGRAVLGRDPAQVAALGAGRAVGQLAGELGKALGRNVFVAQF